MGLNLLFLSSLALSGFQAVSQINQAERESEAAIRQSRLEIQELQRQQREENRIAQEKRSDRVREADKQFASMVAALAERGGAGSQNEFRLGQEIDFLAGIDLARIEGNRRSANAARQSRKVASRNRALTAVNRAEARQTGAVVNFLGSAVSATARRAEAKRQAGGA